MSITLAVLAKSSKHLMLLNLPVPIMQVISSFVIPLVILLLILLPIVNQLNLFVNFLMSTENVSMNDLIIKGAGTNLILQNHLAL